MKRNACFLAALAAILIGCSYSRPFRDPEVCLANFERLERIGRSTAQLRFDYASESWEHPPQLSRQIQKTVTEGCITRFEDLVLPDQLEEIQDGFAIRNDERSIPPTAIQAGVVNGLETSAKAKTIFLTLGYGVRTEGVMQLGRRVFIGPFTSQGALDQALGVAREVGFISPYVTRTRF
ncbi:hypothetical protein [Amaricoccus tamworthensis]|uniref:hypothetical protein n=1 Tax=Amaricoccus tamworthensis TaxID=57002 RepID=UPI003C799B5A